MKRHKIPGGKSRRMFKKHADLSHKRNFGPTQGARAVMRGGIRL